MKENNVCGAGKESKPVCLLSGPRGHLANLHACLAGCVASLPPGPLLRFCSEDLGPEHSRLEPPASPHLSGTTLFFFVGFCLCKSYSTWRWICTVLRRKFTF